MRRIHALAMAAVAIAPMLLTGCVERKFLVTSDPPGAVVLINNVPLNTYTPADGSFLYNGTYDITLIADGYEQLKVRQDIPAKWYDYPPLDFVAENLIPWKIEDKRHLGTYHLVPMQMPRVDEVVSRGEVLRQRALELGTVAPGPAPVPVGPPPTPIGPPPAPTPPVPPPPAP